MGHSRPLAAWKVAISTASPRPSGWSARVVAASQAAKPAAVGRGSTAAKSWARRTSASRLPDRSSAWPSASAASRVSLGAMAPSRSVSGPASRPARAGRGQALGADLEIGHGDGEVGVALQVAQRGLDLGLVEQAAPAPHPKGDAGLVQGPLDERGLGVGAAQHRLRRPPPAGPVVVAHGPGDGPGLGGVVVEHAHRRAAGPSGRLAPSAAARASPTLAVPSSAPPASTALATARICGDDR